MLLDTGVKKLEKQMLEADKKGILHEEIKAAAEFTISRAEDLLEWHDQVFFGGMV